jgi:hypothetical protein
MKKIGWVICLGLLVAFVGCKSSAGVPPKTTERVREVITKEIVKDTFFVVQADSSFYKAYIECVNGKPVLKNPQTKKGRALKAPKVSLKNGQLDVDCEAEAQRLFHEWKEAHTTDREVVTVAIPYAVEKPLSQWQVVQIWCGRLFLFFLLAFIIAVGLRLKKII